MDVKPPAARSAAETCDRGILELAMALAGLPRRDRDQWLLTQTQERAAEALTLGANDQVAQAWSKAWHDFVCSLIVLDSD